MSPSVPTDPYIAETQEWVRRAVVGLNLCPFAAAAMVKNQIRYTLCEATDPEKLLEILRQELHFLASVPPEKTETTLIIHPLVLQDFLEFNQFLEDAEQVVETLGYTGVFQVASFHPAYQFADTETGDITNATNQSPYPTLHIIREESIERGLESFPDPDSIYEANKATLRQLGHQGWSQLRELCRKAATRPPERRSDNPSATES